MDDDAVEELEEDFDDALDDVCDDEDGLVDTIRGGGLIGLPQDERHLNS